MDVHGNFFRNMHKNTLRLFLLFADNFFMFVESIGGQAIRLTMDIIVNFQILEEGGTLGGSPLGFIVIAIIFWSCAIPFLMFIVFGITFVIITFAGFLFIEGTILAIGGLCTCACIISLMLILSAFSLMLWVAYTLALKLNCVLKNFGPTSNILQAVAHSTSNGHVTELTHAHQN